MLKGQGAHWPGPGWYKAYVHQSSCTHHVMSNWVMYWLSLWFFLVFAESQLNAPQRQLEVMANADSTPVATLARRFAFHSQFYELWNCELLKRLWLSDRSLVFCYRDPYYIIIYWDPSSGCGVISTVANTLPSYIAPSARWVRWDIWGSGCCLYVLWIFIRKNPTDFGNPNVV